MNKTQKLQARAEIIFAIRHWFRKEGFLEVETPALSKAGEQNLYIDQFFATNTENKEEQYYLVTSPEYAMKQLLVQGHEKIMQCNKAFRAGETPTRHHQPEFTMLEWYRANEPYKKIMDDTEQLVKSLVKNPALENSIAPEIREYLSQKWRKKTVKQWIEEKTTLNLDKAIQNKTVLEQYIKQQYGTNTQKMEWDDCFHLLWLNEVEPHLGREQPDIVTEYPQQLAALAEKKPENTNYALRFECFLKGIEIANAFQELTDPQEQKQRFKEEQEKRKKQGKKAYPIDEQFLAALRQGMPKSSGIALGVDRLIMVLLQCDDIHDILALPHEN